MPFNKQESSINNILLLKNQRDIYQYIKKNPGLHFSEISRKMKIPKTTLKYHLNRLQKNKLITVSKSKRYLRYYILENTSVKYKKYLNILRIKTNRYILIYITGWIVVSRKELIEELNLNFSTIDKAINQLIKNGLIEKAPVEKGIINGYGDVEIKVSPKGREIFYRLTSSTLEDVFNTFIIYKDTIFKDKSIGNIVENWDDLLDGSRKIPKRMNGNKKAIDKAIENFFDVFPHPYHV